MANFKTQNINVNIIDVDTQKVISKDFTLYMESYSANFLIRGGRDMICGFTNSNYGGTPFTVSLPQMHEYGYEWATPDANIVQREYDPYQGGDLLPAVINLYLRKRG
ncbi:MAG: hypothetical protein E6772_15985 [Dysgonomonas sp.]|nr:hypothetical protein [Dysgonomonas sp.]